MSDKISIEELQRLRDEMTISQRKSEVAVRALEKRVAEYMLQNKVPVGMVIDLDDGQVKPAPRRQ